MKGREQLRDGAEYCGITLLIPFDAFNDLLNCSNYIFNALQGGLKLDVTCIKSFFQASNK
jgi:hypothetical protein